MARYSRMLADDKRGGPEGIVVKSNRRNSVEGVRSFACDKRGQVAIDFLSKTSKKDKGSSTPDDKDFGLSARVAVTEYSRMWSVGESPLVRVHEGYRYLGERLARQPSQDWRDRRRVKLAMTLSVVSSQTHFFIEKQRRNIS